MHLYAESSAALAWLLDQRHGALVAAALERAAVVVASDLTLIECDRVLIRAVAQRTLAERELVQRQARLNAVSAHWTLLAVDEEIGERARRPFPVEPVRTLDALHLASMLTARKALPDLVVLSLDDRVREAADRLGLPLAPTAAELGS